MNARRWLREHSLKLLAIRDTPQSIAGGVAIGVFFGFAPLFGLKTLLSIVLAWLTRSNVLAAVLAGAMHELVLPLMPVIYAAEYKIGYWLLTSPHHWPTALYKMSWDRHAWFHWKTLLTVGKPMLLGSVVCGVPFSLATFFLTAFLVERHQRKKYLPLLPPGSGPAPLAMPLDEDPE